MSQRFDELQPRWRPITGPAAEPLHRTEAKAQCGLLSDQADFDADFDRWISTARERVESQAEIALVTQTWELSLRGFPCGEPIELRLWPLQALTSFQYVDMAGELQDFEDYTADLAAAPGTIEPAFGFAWPAARLQVRAVILQFRPGCMTSFTVDTAANTLTPLPQHFANNDILRVMQSGGSVPGGLAALTDYHVINAGASTLKLAAAEGGAAIDLTSPGSGNLFLGTQEIPSTALQAMRLLIGHYWRHRETVLSGTSSGPVAETFDALLHDLKWRW